MKTSPKIDIIMFNMSNYTDWQKGIVNRNYYITQTLAADERIGKIIAVDFLPIGFGTARKLKYFVVNLVMGAKAYDRDQKVSIGGGDTKFGDLTSRCYQLTSKIYAFSSVNNFNTVLDELVEVKKRLELNNLLIWSYNPIIPNLAKIKNKLNAKAVIFDTVDDWSKHNISKNRKDILEKNYQQIQKEADVVFTVSRDLKERLFNNNSNVHWIPNGVDMDEFKPSAKIPDDTQNIKRPIIGYLGVIQERLDIDLVKYLAEKNPDKSFVFVGWVWGSWLWGNTKKVVKQKLGDLKNVYFLGRKKVSERSSYIQNFDVAIIPHKVNEFTKTMNPLKMYEYLACGKPVVSTPISGIEEFDDLIKTTSPSADGKEEFNKLINEALEEDNEELQKRRIEAVIPHSWENRVEKMFEIIEGIKN